MRLAAAELVPRFLMETAFLRCHRFSCQPEGFTTLVDRLTSMARGITHPTVQAYARMYLVYTVQQGRAALPVRSD